jgi:23S rRNA (pseudouridine1915-N3)-methyltransferase
MPAWVNAGYDEYAKRMPRDFAIELIELKPEPRDRGKTVAQLLTAEALRIRAACAGFQLIALDERGAAWTTSQLAAHLERWRDGALDVAFVIGSADGLDPALKHAADAVMTLSSMTLPHGLARVMLAEQLYRAVSVNAGHPYHRE